MLQTRVARGPRSTMGMQLVCYECWHTGSHFHLPPKHAPLLHAFCFQGQALGREFPL